MKKSIELRRDKADVISKMRALVERAEARSENLNTEEKSEWEKMNDSVNQLEERIARLEDVEKQEADIDSDTGNDDETKKENSRSRRIYAGSESGKEYRGISCPNYRKAFRKAITSGYMAPEYRDAILGTDSQGGYFALPVELSKQFVYAQNNLSFMRTVSTIEKLTQAKSLGVRKMTTIPTVSWNGEVDSQSPESDMALGRRDLNPNLLSVIEAISLRLLSASPDAEQYVMDRMNYAVSAEAENKFLNGSGSDQPLGIFHASSDGISSARDVVSSVALASAFKGDDVIKTFYSIPQQYTMSKKFGVFVGRGAMGYIRTLKTSTGQYLLEPGLAGNRPDTLLGATIFQSEYAPAFNSASPSASQYVLCFGDFKFYTIAEVVGDDITGGIDLQILNERYADSHERGYVLRYWVDGAPTLENAFARLKLAAS
jgi:HK97 family phage major capsid protein